MKNQKKLFLVLIPTVIIVLIILAIPIAKMNYRYENINVKPGDTLSSILSPKNLSDQDILEIAKLLKKDGGVKNLKADCDVIKIESINDSKPANKVIIQSDPWKQIEFTKTNSGWTCNQIEIEKDTQIVRKTGEIRDGDSFYSAGIRAGIPEAVLADAYDLLAFEMDFERDMRAGQQFQILYEENYADGDFVNTGSIISLSFDAGKRGIIKMYRYTKADGRIGYYDENGGGAIKSLKRTPINNARVTSSFSGKRKHPILGYTRSHQGVDFRASVGTPIPSAGAGRVVSRGSSNSGYGNFIRIRHNATYETLYAHMSKFQSGVTVGSQVKQGQIVGYVGETGIATGPHLHYEIIKNGRRANPMVVKLPAIDSLSDKDKNSFLALRTKIDKSIELLSKFPTLVIYEKS